MSIDLQHGEEGLLRQLDRADGLHTLLALFCFSSSFRFRLDVAAVALRRDVLAQRLDRDARITRLPIAA